MLLGGLVALWLGGGLIWASFGALLGVIASVWSGLQGQRLPWWPLAAANVAAVVLAPLVAALALSALSATTAISYETPQSGIYNQGAAVANLYAYDAQGRRLDGVRIFDQSGRPLVVSGEVAELLASARPSAGTSFWAADGLPRQSDTFPTLWLGSSPWDAMSAWQPPLTIVPAHPESGPSGAGTASPTPAATATTSRPPTPSSTTSRPTDSGSPRSRETATTSPPR